MAHEVAKLLLEQAANYAERQEAVKQAINLKMPLHEIEQYLDWLDSRQGRPVKQNENSRRADTGDKVSDSP